MNKTSVDKKEAPKENTEKEIKVKKKKKKIKKNITAWYSFCKCNF